jgi:hypothetical protein
MRLWVPALGLLVQCPVLLSAQTPSMADLDKARLEISRLEELYKQGAVAKNRLDQAKALLEDSSDDAILRKTLFGDLKIEDLKPEQIEEMLAAARRRVERMQPRIEAKQRLVDEGVLARTELAPDLEELEMRRRTVELAESRAKTFELLLETIRAEEEAVARAEEAREQADKLRSVEHYEGTGAFRIAMLKGIEQAFERKFQKPLPVSALGMTELHRSMGFDHRDRVDVALTPDSPEGIWLREFLELNRLPYYAFRSFLPGRATGAHIHIGPPSVRLPRLASSE